MRVSAVRGRRATRTSMASSPPSPRKAPHIPVSVPTSCTRSHRPVQGSIPICQVFVQPLLAVAPPRPSSSVGMFTYPAIAAVVGAPEYADAACTALRNPTAHCRGDLAAEQDFAMDEKFLRYRRGLPVSRNMCSSLQTGARLATTVCSPRSSGPSRASRRFPTCSSSTGCPSVWRSPPSTVGCCGPSPDDTDAPKEEIPPWQWYDR